MYINRPHKTTKALQLFCFPYAGGNASAYRPWANDSNMFAEILTIQLPARGELFTQEAITDMSLLVEKLFQEILPYLERPFAFFGHSMGGIIAYALLRKIEEHTAYRAEYIVISATKPPFKYHNSQDHLLGDHALKEKLISHNATPQQLLDSDELMALILPTYRADLELLSGYSPAPLPKLQVKAYLFNDKSDIDVECMLRWGDYFEKKVGYYEFEGGHFFINSHKDLVIDTLSTLPYTAYDK